MFSKIIRKFLIFFNFKSILKVKKWLRTLKMDQVREFTGEFGKALNWVQTVETIKSDNLLKNLYTQNKPMSLRHTDL